MKKIFSIFITFFIVCCAFAQTTEAEDPIIILAPDTFVNKQAFSFTDQGITISITKASAYPADHEWNNLKITYFACIAGEQMTISAEEPIKGIAINGWTKKNFSATADFGTLSFLSDEYEDTTGEPVLTISDIDNPSVTFSCDNQLRCFSVEVYFTQNPGELSGEVLDTVRFVAVTAEASDFSEDTTFSSEGHYSYWLKLEPETIYPHVWLDMYSAKKGDLSGEYSMYNYNVGDYTYVQLGAETWEYEYAYDQEFTITKTDAGYHVEGWIICDNDVQYEFVYDGPIELEPEEEGVETITDAQPRAIKQLQDGVLFVEKNGRTYTLLGEPIR